MTESVFVSAAVEGVVDEHVVRRIITHVGGVPGTIYGKSGKAALQRKIQGYNNAAKHAPWLVLVDLDRDADCAPPLCAAWLSDPAPRLCFRVAVRAVEAWLLADARTLASFLSVAYSRMPSDPEQVIEPKNEIVNLARNSRRREIREDMVPRAGNGRPVGPAYTGRLVEYIQKSWRPEIAMKRADSLSRTIGGLRRLVEGHL